MHIICFYVPKEHAENVKEAMFAAGGGRIGLYDRCSWQTSGFGQYRPLPGSQPFHGEQNKLETVEELKVEMACSDVHISAVIKALRQAHPYETPAFHVIKDASR